MGTGGAIDFEGMDTGEPFQDKAEEEVSSVQKPRRPWISTATRKTLRRTLGCDACSGLGTGLPGTAQTAACWKRSTQIMETTEEGQEAILKEQARMEQYHNIISASVKPESVQDIPAPALPPTPQLPQDDEVEEQNSDEEAAASNQRIEASIDAIFKRYISC